MNYSDMSLEELETQLLMAKKEVSRFKNAQMAKKVQL